MYGAKVFPWMESEGSLLYVSLIAPWFFALKPESGDGSAIHP
jgi:hypothetical protein